MARHQHIRYVKSTLAAATLDDQLIGDQPGDGGLGSFDFPPEHTAIAVGVERYALPGEIEHADVEGTVETPIGSRGELQIAGASITRLGLRRAEEKKHA